MEQQRGDGALPRVSNATADEALWHEEEAAEADDDSGRCSDEEKEEDEEESGQSNSDAYSPEDAFPRRVDQFSTKDVLKWMREQLKQLNAQTARAQWERVRDAMEAFGMVGPDLEASLDDFVENLTDADDGLEREELLCTSPGSLHAVCGQVLSAWRQWWREREQREIATQRQQDEARLHRLQQESSCSSGDVLGMEHISQADVVAASCLVVVSYDSEAHALRELSRFMQNEANPGKHRFVRAILGNTRDHIRDSQWERSQEDVQDVDRQRFLLAESVEVDDDSNGGNADGLDRDNVQPLEERTVWVSFPGTDFSNPVDRATNVQLLPEFGDGAGSGMVQVHRGFWRRVEAMQGVLCALLSRLQGVSSDLDSGSPRYRRIVICGHSQGGAVAHLAAWFCLRKLHELYGVKDGPITSIGFGAPAFARPHLVDDNFVTAWKPRFLTVVNDGDLVPSLFAIAQGVVMDATALSQEPQALEEDKSSLAGKLLNALSDPAKLVRETLQKTADKLFRTAVRPAVEVMLFYVPLGTYMFVPKNPGEAGGGVIKVVSQGAEVTDRLKLKLKTQQWRGLVGAIDDKLFSINFHWASEYRSRCVSLSSMTRDARGGSISKNNNNKAPEVTRWEEMLPSLNKVDIIVHELQKHVQVALTGCNLDMLGDPPMGNLALDYTGLDGLWSSLQGQFSSGHTECTLVGQLTGLLRGTDENEHPSLVVVSPFGATEYSLCGRSTSAGLQALLDVDVLVKVILRDGQVVETNRLPLEGHKSQRSAKSQQTRMLGPEYMTHKRLLESAFWQGFLLARATKAKTHPLIGKLRQLVYTALPPGPKAMERLREFDKAVADGLVADGTPDAMAKFRTGPCFDALSELWKQLTKEPIVEFENSGPRRLIWRTNASHISSSTADGSGQSYVNMLHYVVESLGHPSMSKVAILGPSLEDALFRMLEAAQEARDVCAGMVKGDEVDDIVGAGQLPFKNKSGPCKVGLGSLASATEETQRMALKYSWRALRMRELRLEMQNVVAVSVCGLKKAGKSTALQKLFPRLNVPNRGNLESTLNVEGFLLSEEGGGTGAAEVGQRLGAVARPQVILLDYPAADEPHEQARILTQDTLCASSFFVLVVSALCVSDAGPFHALVSYLREEARISFAVLVTQADRLNPSECGNQDQLKGLRDFARQELLGSDNAPELLELFTAKPEEQGNEKQREVLRQAGVLGLKEGDALDFVVHAVVAALPEQVDREYVESVLRGSAHERE